MPLNAKASASIEPDVFSPFDKRGYPTINPRIGYGEWAAHYEATVATGLDRPLLDHLTSPDWINLTNAVDLACGTGRTGMWLAQHGVRHIDGVDVTLEMLEFAKIKHVYRHLHVADVAATALRSSTYELCTMVLADEHIAELAVPVLAGSTGYALADITAWPRGLDKRLENPRAFYATIAFVILLALLRISPTLVQ